MGIIFDLDQTLIDSSISQELRNSRRWNDVYALIPKFDVYPGIKDLINNLNFHNIPTCVVTSSPSFYCDKVLKFHGIDISKKVCYHDTTEHKPHPGPILRGAELLNMDPSVIWSIGDHIDDINASLNAGVNTTIAAIWDSKHKERLKGIEDVILIENVEQLNNLIFNYF